MSSFYLQRVCAPTPTDLTNRQAVFSRRKAAGIYFHSEDVDVTLHARLAFGCHELVLPAGDPGLIASFLTTDGQVDG